MARTKIVTGSRQQLGKIGEETAVEFLRSKGYSIVECNYRCRYGEIDIIAEADSEIVFVEVKTRSTLRMGMPSEAVTFSKQQKIYRVAQHFLSSQGKEECGARFDVIAIVKSRAPGCGQPQIEHIKNAFDGFD